MPRFTGGGGTGAGTGTGDDEDDSDSGSTTSSRTGSTGASFDSGSGTGTTGSNSDGGSMSDPVPDSDDDGSGGSGRGGSTGASFTSGSGSGTTGDFGDESSDTGGTERSETPTQRGSSETGAVPTRGDSTGGTTTTGDVSGGPSREAIEAARQFVDTGAEGQGLEEGNFGPGGRGDLPEDVREKARDLEQQAIGEFEFADDPSDVSVVERDGELVATPTRDAVVGVTAQQLEDMRSQFVSGLDTDAINESDVGFDIEDITVVDTSQPGTSGSTGAEPTAGGETAGQTPTRIASGVGFDIDQDAQEQALREELASQSPDIEPSDVVVEETEQGLRASPSQEVLEQQVREELASQDDRVNPEDITVSFEDGEVSASAEVESDRQLSDLVDVDVGFDRTALVDVDRQPISIDVESDFELPSLEDLDERTTPPPAIDDFEAAVLDRAFSGAPSDIREVEEEILGDRETREENFQESLMEEVEGLEVTEENQDDFVPDISGRDIAAAGAIGIATPEPVSSVGGAGAVAIGGTIIAGGLVADAARRGELDIAGTEIEEVGVGRRIPQEELGVSEPTTTELTVEENEVTGELQPGRTQPESELDVGGEGSGDFGDLSTQQMLEQQEVVEEEERRQEVAQRIITGEDIVTDLPEPDQQGPSVREQQQRDDLFTPERGFFTGESSVVGREVERVEEAEQLEVLQDADVGMELDEALFTQSRARTGQDLVPALGVETGTGLDVDAVTDQTALVDSQTAQMLEQQLAQQTRGMQQAQAVGTGMGNVFENVEQFDTGVQAGTAPGDGAFGDTFGFADLENSQRDEAFFDEEIDDEIFKSGILSGEEAFEEAFDD